MIEVAVTGEEESSERTREPDATGKVIMILLILQS